MLSLVWGGPSFYMNLLPSSLAFVWFRVYSIVTYAQMKYSVYIVWYKKERKKERKNVYLSSSNLKQHCFYSKHIEFIAQERLAGGLFLPRYDTYVLYIMSGRYIAPAEEKWARCNAGKFWYEEEG